MASPSHSATGLSSADDTSNGAANPKKRKHIDLSEDTVPLSFKSYPRGHTFIHTFQVHKSMVLEHFPNFEPSKSLIRNVENEGLTIFVCDYSSSVGQRFLKWIYYQEVDDIAKKIDDIGKEDAIKGIMELHKIAVRQNMEDFKLAIQEIIVKYFSEPLDFDRLCEGINLFIGKRSRSRETIVLKVLLKILVNNFTTDEIRRFSREKDQFVLGALTEVLLDKEDERQKASEIEEGYTSETLEVE